MATERKVLIPDLGGAEGVEVIEILVKKGQEVVEEDSLITLEGDKATMEVPAPCSGVVSAIEIKLGDKVAEGTVCLSLKVAEEVVSTHQEVKQDADVPKKDKGKPVSKTVVIPDLGGASDVEVIECLVAVGTDVVEEQALITLEGDKATMEVPSPYAGKIESIAMKVGQKVAEGDAVLTLLVVASDDAAVKDSSDSNVGSTTAKEKVDRPSLAITKPEDVLISGQTSGPVYAGPTVRRYADVYGVDLGRVKGSSRGGRIVKDDVTRAIQALVSVAQSGQASAPKKTARALPDFTKFGEVEVEKLSKIKKLTGTFLSENWNNIPHVTQNDTADITELEALRKTLNIKLASEGVKLSPLVFMMKAVSASLQAFPNFNASLTADGSELVLKKYVHLGIAVDTPNGLVVPVIRDVDQKDLAALTHEVIAMAEKARTVGLAPKDMQGGCFTISSLGGIGGGHFTPIINAPEVAILGVSRMSRVPVWRDEQWLPSLQLPLSLSYDHRVIDGADGARFITDLVERLQDVKSGLFEA